MTKIEWQSKPETEFWALLNTLYKVHAAFKFSGLLYCADCGAKLSLAAANGNTHFRCSMYKRTSRAKECTQHDIPSDKEMQEMERESMQRTTRRTA